MLASQGVSREAECGSTLPATVPASSLCRPPLSSVRSRDNPSVCAHMHRSTSSPFLLVPTVTPRCCKHCFKTVWSWMKVIGATPAGISKQVSNKIFRRQTRIYFRSFVWLAQNVFQLHIQKFFPQHGHQHAVQRRPFFKVNFRKWGM